VKFQIFKSANNHQWYWNMVADNGKIIAASGEGYINRNDAVHGLVLVRQNAASATAWELGADGKWFIPN